MSKQTEMESIYNSYEWLIREKLEKLDCLARNLYTEMSTFGIPLRISRVYVQQQFAKLVEDISREGDSLNGKKNN